MSNQRELCSYLGTFFSFPSSTCNVWGCLDTVSISSSILAGNGKNSRKIKPIWPQCSCQLSSGLWTRLPNDLPFLICSPYESGFLSIIIHALSYFSLLYYYRTLPDTVLLLTSLFTTAQRPFPKKAVDIMMKLILPSLFLYFLLLDINYPWLAVPLYWFHAV